MGKPQTRNNPRRPLPATMAAAACAGILVAASHSAGPAGASTPLEVFGGLPTLEDVVISPDGSELAFVRTREDRRLVLVGLLVGAEALGGVRVGDIKLRVVEWIDDDNILATIAST